MSYNCLWNELFSERFFWKICFASLPSIVEVQTKSWRMTSGLLALQINEFFPSYLVALSSKSFDIHCCVPKGSFLGQILCIMYVSRIFNGVKNHPPSIHVYADDIQLYLSFKPLSTLVFATWCVQSISLSLYSWSSSLDDHQPTQDKRYKNGVSLCGFLPTVEQSPVWIGHCRDSEIKLISSVRNLRAWF